MTNKPFIYDKELKRVSCYSYYEFLKTLTMLNPTKSINVEASSRVPYTIITETGETFQYVDWYTMFPRLVTDFGINHDPLKSFKSLDTYVLYVDEPLELVDVEINVEELQQETAPLVSLDVEDKEELVEDKPAPKVEEVVEVDWDYVDGLYDAKDKKGSKDKLEEYARGFNVELAKNKSFQNMVKDFVKAVK